MTHEAMAITVGSERPAMSVSWELSESRHFSGFVVIFSEYDPDNPDDNDYIPSVPVCLGCLLEDGDAQLGRGLDLAKRYGQVDYDTGRGEWFVPD